MKETKLFDFGVAIGAIPAGEPTRVDDKRGEDQLTALTVYLASSVGFDNFCGKCEVLRLVQETGSYDLSLRVFCGAFKCQR